MLSIFVGHPRIFWVSIFKGQPRIWQQNTNGCQFLGQLIPSKTNQKLSGEAQPPHSWPVKISIFEEDGIVYMKVLKAICGEPIEC